MTVVDKRPVPIYEVECFECHSTIRYKKCEVSYGFISCPVCGVSISVFPLSPAFYECEGEE